MTDHSRAWGWLLVALGAFGYPSFVGYVLWCSWAWHAVPLGLPPVPYSAWTVGVYVWSLMRLSISRDDLEMMRSLEAGQQLMRISYFQALLTLAAAWVLA